MAGWLAPQLTGSLSLVIHSNYLRARQTWQAIAPELPEALKIEESGEITPYGDPAFVASYLTALAADGKMAKESCSGWKDRIQYGKS